MPMNKGKGDKNRHRSKNENELRKKELVFKEDEQENAWVIELLENGRLEEMCFDGVKRLCNITGKIRIKKTDVILKYNADEAIRLKAYGKLPEHAKINERDIFGPADDDEIEFDDIGDDEDIDGI
ncbi:eukaryotic translation initiation factor 1A, X-chromosomal-like [Tamandua tetradactyla]|uniref:eukaryotic translation initiation factor 1A, X-chromosomal-like n=1 Tax=Tamandua tetradactyla TaxID=48850 RepID=UPI004053EAF7